MKSVISATRRFVCIRTLTYEDAEERDFQRALFIGRSGDVENTTFCILSPDGKQPITRAGRGVRQIFQSPDQMSKWMGEAADYYEAERKKAGLKPVSPNSLPVAATVRLGLNAAAADNLPLVVLYGKNAEEASQMETAAAALAWKPEFIGRCTFVVTSNGSDLIPITSEPVKPGFLVVQPEGFGLKGKILGQADAGSPDKLADTLRQGLKLFRAQSLRGFDYMRAGNAAGAFWDTKLPVTDFQEAQARQRGRRFIPPRDR